jgi:crotonobetainyl-CoA:carnitine CoA-transferase CaiB-like acyl-CoA transferase
MQEQLMQEKGPLAGISILDIGSMLAAPWSTTMLADQGAQVIKIEPPGIGDVQRYVGAIRNGFSGLHQAVNRGKRSLVLDMKNPAGLDAVHQLVASTDVLVHNFRPGVAEKLGVDYATLATINPQLVYLSVTGFGHEGPMAGKAAYDNVIQAFAGVALNHVDAETGEPSQYHQLFSDKMTAMYACQAITSALFARERGAGGQHIQLAMVDAVASFLWPDVAGTSAFLEEGAEIGMAVANAVPLVRFKDGYGQVAPVQDKQFHGYCAAFGVDSSDPRLATVIDRAANSDFMMEIVAVVMAHAEQVPVDEAMARMEAADVPCARAYHLQELPSHPQMQANGLFVETQHPVAGRMVEPRYPANFSKTPADRGQPAASLGEHSREILSELGFDDAAIERLAQDGVLG